MTISVYGWTNGNGGTHHYRVAEPLRALHLSGFSTHTGPLMDANVQDYFDMIVAHMPHEEIPTKIWGSLAMGGHNKLVVDIDDYAWNYPKGSGTESHWTAEHLLNLENNMRIAHAVTTPNLLLAEHVAQFNPNVYVVPNTVPLSVVNSRSNRPDYRKFRIGYQGASQHKLDFTERTMEAISLFLTAHPYAELHLFGFSDSSVYIPPKLAKRIIVTPWNSDLDSYYRSLQFEVGIGPLSEHEFNRYKSDIRYREYMAVGALPILQANGVYADLESSWNYHYPHQLYDQLHRAYQLWHSPRSWGEQYRERRAFAKEEFTTENNAGKVADVYRRIYYRDRD